MAGNYYKYSPYRGTLLTDVSTIRYSDLEDAGRGVTGGPNVVFIESALLASDYSGNDGGVVRSNVNWWHENFGDTDGVLWWDVSGGHSTFGIAVLADVLDTNSAFYAEHADDEDLLADAERIREAIEGLENYPLLDEEGYSELEMEFQDAQFDDDASDVYMGHIRASFAELLAGIIAGTLRVEKDEYGRSTVARMRGTEDEEAEEAAAAAFTQESLRALYYTMGEQFSVYPYTEGSGDNVAVIFSFDDFIVGLAEALEALPPQGQIALRQKLDTALRGSRQDVQREFEYQGPGYHLVRLGRDLRHRDVALNQSDLKLLDPSLTDDMLLVLMDMVLESDPALVRAAFRDGTLVQQLIQRRGPLSGPNVLSGLLNRWKS